MNGYKNVTMKTETKRRLRTLQHKFGAEAAFRSAQGLAKYLNRRHGKPTFERVERVVAALNQIDAVVRAANYPRNAYPRIYEGEFGEKVKQLKELVDDFMHEVRLVIGLGEPREDGWSATQVLSLTHPAESKRETYTDALFVFDAATHGQLRLVYQCDFCAGWFVRKREDHRFCPTGCRQKANRQTDEGRAKWAGYMRKFRAGQRRMKEEHIKWARTGKA
jgi:hypothetical protein